MLHGTILHEGVTPNVTGGKGVQKMGKKALHIL